MKQHLITAAIALGVSALYFHAIGPAVSKAMSKDDAEPAPK